MHYPSSGALVFAVFLALTHQCQPICPADQTSPDQAQEPVTQVELSLKDGFLTAIHDGLELVTWELPDAAPYRIVTLGPPIVVTTCNAGLKITTIIATPSLPSFVNMLPILVEPPFAVLAEMAVPDTTQNGKISLVSADGEVVWHDLDGMLLRPGAGKLPDGVYMFATTPGSTPILPMGENSELVLVNGQTATEQWRTTLSLARTPVDAQLLAVDNGRGLLLLQYGYVSFEFVVLDLNSGDFLKSWQLSGQVATQMIFPGGFSRLSPFNLDNHLASLLVINLAEPAQFWSFNLERLSLLQSPAGPQVYNIDENGLPLGGTRIPGPGNPPFPQGILPTQFGNEWVIPALVDGQGRVLVVIGNKATWISYN